MIESIMYFGIGFLFATLVALAIVPFVHSRAVRLTIRRLEESIPQSMAEIQAGKDALRAEFAMSTRRLEVTIDELKNKHAKALAELGEKANGINRLKIAREAQKVEVAALKAEVVALTDRLAAADKEIEPVRGQLHADDIVSLVPKDRGEEAQSVGFLNDTGDARDLDQRIEPGGNRLPAAASSIRVPRRSSDFRTGRFASDKPSIGKRISSNLVYLFIVALIGVGAAFAWRQYDPEGAEKIFGMVSSLGSSATRSPLDVAAKQTGSTPADVSAHDEQLSQPAPITQTSPAPAVAEKAQSSDESQAVEQDIEQKTSSPPLQNSTTTLETRATPLVGWMLREITNGTAVLEGPTGIWRVTPGDTVPGVGKVESYIRSNGQWIVATSSGLISTRDRPNASSPALQSDTKLPSTVEARPKNIEDWTLREVTNGTAVLQGPIGILRVTLGDTVAGLGKVTAIVRWGKGWVVATSEGYCTSASPDHADGICKRYSRAPH